MNNDEILLYEVFMNKNNIFVLLLFLLIGLIFGGIIGDYLGQFIPLLNYSKAIGINSFNLDLSVIKFSFSFSMNISFASVIGLILAIMLHRRL